MITMRYQIAVRGCDASTYIEKELTAEQFRFLAEVASEITKASTYGCEPTMEVKRLTEEPA